MAKTISKANLTILVNLSNDYAKKGTELEAIFQKLVHAVAVKAKAETADDVKAISQAVADAQHAKVYGNLTAAQVKKAAKGELEKKGFTKKGKRKGITEVQGIHTRNAWNLILRAYKAGVAVLDGDKGKGWTKLSADIKDSMKPATTKMNAKVAEEMKDTILAELTKVAHDVKKYKKAKDGLENGLKGILEEVFGYKFKTVK